MEGDVFAYSDQISSLIIQVQEYIIAFLNIVQQWFPLIHEEGSELELLASIHLERSSWDA
jgi:hypothetical protein